MARRRARTLTRWVMAIGLGLAVFGGPGRAPGWQAAAQTRAVPRPNIVMIMVDDLDAASMATAIQEGFMPRFTETILQGGTALTASFVTLSLCCPSRSTYLTGQYSHNHGIVRNRGQFGGFGNFDDDSTVATWLWAGGDGYLTAHVGKYLNGYRDGTYVPPGWDDWQALVDPSTYCMYDYTISNNGDPKTYGHTPADYQTDVLATLSAQFITTSDATDDARPTFLSIAPLAPHLEGACNPGNIRSAPRHQGSVSLPLPKPPSFNEPDMSDKPAWMRSRPLVDEAYMTTIYNDRIEALRAVDDLIGVVAAALRDAGELETTAFIFTSDNGYLLGLHRWQGKILLYEESIRVPLFLKVPGIPGPAAVGEFASTTTWPRQSPPWPGSHPGFRWTDAPSCPSSRGLRRCGGSGFSWSSRLRPSAACVRSTPCAPDGHRIPTGSSTARRSTSRGHASPTASTTIS